MMSINHSIIAILNINDVGYRYIIDGICKSEVKFSKECKYIEKEKMMIRYVTDNLENSSDDSNEYDGN